MQDVRIRVERPNHASPSHHHHHHQQLQQQQRPLHLFPKPNLT